MCNTYDILSQICCETNDYVMLPLLVLIFVIENIGPHTLPTKIYLMGDIVIMC